MVTIGKRFTFEAGHQIPNHPGKCARPHGHSYKAIVEVTGPVTKQTGMVLDFYVLGEIAHKVIDLGLDHQNLNIVFNGDTPWHPSTKEAYILPTAEYIAQYLFNAFQDRLAVILKSEKVEENIRISKVTVFETEDCFAIYTDS